MVEIVAIRRWETQQVQVLIRDYDHGVIYGRDSIHMLSDFRGGRELPPEAYALTIPDQFFEAVVDKLNQLRTGEVAPGDAYALRRDLTREQGRVDKMLDVVLDLAHNPPMEVTTLHAAIGPQGPPGPPGPRGKSWNEEQ